MGCHCWMALGHSFYMDYWSQKLNFFGWPCLSCKILHWLVVDPTHCRIFPQPFAAGGFLQVFQDPRSGRSKKSTCLVAC